MTDADELMHYGILRRSGRYPWGSGATPFERSSRGFLAYVDELKSKGMSDVEIAKAFETTTTQIRATKSIALNEARRADAAQALRLKDKGLSNAAIGRRMGINESSVRALLDPAMKDRRDILITTANLLRDKMGDGYLDVGAGTESHLGISATKLAAAVAVLKEEGYEVRNVQVPQLGTSHKTTVKTLVPPGAPKFIDPTKIKPVASYSEDGGRTQEDIKPPVNISSKRVAVNYADQGGADADGVIYVRRGVPDVSLGSSSYAQVRIAVDGTHYLKGMAMYKDDMPEGADLLFNTNKRDTGNKLDAMKSQKEDEQNPFGTITRQRHYIGEDGKPHQSIMNIVNDEGQWNDWSRTLSSQALSKQSTSLAKRQLDLTLKSKQDEFDEISRLTNPVIKKKLLDAFADSADSAAVHLKAAALPRQRTQVILPISSLKEGEIHAPNFHNGERVALIRFPHGGTFEIPELVVNNRNPEAHRALATAKDAVGIHPKVAARLSGADFDGDSVLVIPNNRGELKTSPPLKGLENFDPKEHYPPFDGMKTIDGGTWDAKAKKAVYPESSDGTPIKPKGGPKQQQMGDISNLITDMTVRGADDHELAAAVRHSMVVIDSEKHSLNVKQSYIDNGITSLKEKYQGRGPTGRLRGASTLISRSGLNATVRVPDRRPRPASQGGPIDLATGKKMYVPRGESYVDKNGKLVTPTIKSTRLGEVDDAHTLSSGMPIEHIYAEHSNSLKALANKARLESVHTGGLSYSKTAAKTYEREVSKLNADLNIALKNAPLERQAQLVANAIVSARLRDNPGLDNADRRKIQGQALTVARARVGAGKTQVPIDAREWEAIQSGAISTNKLRRILDNTDLDKIKELATPRTTLKMTDTKVARARAMLAAGYTRADIAEALGVSLTTLYKSLGSE